DLINHCQFKRQRVITLSTLNTLRHLDLRKFGMGGVNHIQDGTQTTKKQPEGCFFRMAAAAAGQTVIRTAFP
ncbi:hypothetical protein, partial [Pseudomonas sp. BBP2017]|uniref:hypothetical protein n=1 Tax=Pseudomonas sp. BBP2017 TaxID=2109731 RepID=UPI001C491E92